MCLASKHENFNLKVEYARLHIVQGVQKPHANSRQFCVLTGQKDSSGCGACRMATVYRTLERVFNPEIVRSHNQNKTPQGTGVFFSCNERLLLLVGFVGNLDAGFFKCREKDKFLEGGWIAPDWI